MPFYKPKWLVVLGLINSAIASVQLPIFGYLLSKMVFSLMKDPKSQEFIDDRNFWTWMFMIMCIGLFISTFI